MISNRIVELQKECSYRGKNPERTHFDRDYHYAGLNLFSNLNHSLKIAESMAYAISNMDVYVYENDRLGGRTYHFNEEPIEIKCEEFDYLTSAFNKVRDTIDNYPELIKNQLIADLYNGAHLACNGHIGWRYDKILSLGVLGLRKLFEEALDNPKDEKAKEFYEGVIIMLDALLAFNDKHVEAYERLGNFELADRMRNVPRYPCKNFKDAVQAFFMQHIVVMRENPFGGNSPGRLDYFLWPYLKKDLEDGIITLEEAKEIIDELFLRIDERIYEVDIWGETIVVGGTDEEGNSAVNPLTYIMIESIIDLNITHPYVYLRIPNNASHELYELAAKYVKNGYNRAQILNDNAIINSLVNFGVEYKDAVNYMCGGCMEIGIQGKNCDFLYGGFQNTHKMLELLITGGDCLITGKKVDDFNYCKGLVNYNDFDSFYNDYLAVVKKYAYLSFKIMEIFNELAAINRPSYLLSSMIDDCLERGRNLNDDGAKYHNYGTTPIALPDVVDSLYAIKYALFDNKICTALELVEAIKYNFKGYEKLQYKLREIPKFGTDNEEVDNFSNSVVSDVIDIYNSYENRLGGKGNAVILTFIHAPYVASILGARPSGLNANFTIAHGLTPCSSSIKDGITAAINSCCRLPFDKISGGASTMWDFDANWASKEVLTSIIKTFMENNGQMIQGNATNVNELLYAQKNPLDYSHLIVRVGGYSARFINLSNELQNEIINRMRHNR